LDLAYPRRVQKRAHRHRIKIPRSHHDLPENQKHLTLFIHGHDDDWIQTVGRYDAIATQLFDGTASLGELSCFDWPSKGSLLAYLRDRAEARQTDDDLTNLLSTLYAWMSAPQIAATVSLNSACRAKTSISATAWATMPSNTP
jgi:esterase/lipase superfamily enzyme